MTELLTASDEVVAALAEGRPVVALESTVIAHGLPSPQNFEVAKELERLIRDTGAVPATVAVLKNRLRVGLDPKDIEELAAGGADKLSSGDLGPAVTSGNSGATTVSATMVAAQLAGIRVFATGGIGGVHRGAAQSFDVSTDLEELGRTKVAVVCSGAKAILDLPATLQYLETKGVPVLGYRTQEFPAFYSPTSGLTLRNRADSPAEAANSISAHWRLGGTTGVLVANPIPAEEGLPNEEVERYIAEAESEMDGLSGPEVTPFLLARLAELSSGATVTANVALLRSNAVLAAEIAVALS
ncbi:MAG: pseudouridine-5'-phosphate glycosidase [Acidimicrobiia bacterium]|nr:pseudouridine-5'-phosphate glycosidase [Acidimicrobiia bacterium]MDH3469961.1 pseudouridine-5'-phosphate glycosidase [Acidimicrobiia bacterium]